MQDSDGRWARFVDAKEFKSKFDAPARIVALSRIVELDSVESKAANEEQVANLLKLVGLERRLIRRRRHENAQNPFASLQTQIQVVKIVSLWTGEALSTTTCLSHLCPSLSFAIVRISGTNARRSLPCSEVKVSLFISNRARSPKSIVC